MNVNGSAFYFGDEALSQDVNFPAFFTWLKARLEDDQWPPQRINAPGYAYERKIYINDLADAWCGVILSGKTGQLDHYLQKVGLVHTVVAREREGEPPVELNFFCLRKDSHKGIYSHYHGSYSFGSFQRDLWGAYVHFVRAKKDEALALLPAGADKAQVKFTEKQYSLHKKALYSPLYNPGTFDDLVAGLTEVQEVRMTTYKIDGPTDRPMRDKIKNVHQVYRLSPAPVTDAMKAWIRKKRKKATRVLKNDKSTFSGSVLGVNANGSISIPFTSTLDNQIDFKYDDIGDCNLTDIAANPCLAALFIKVRTAPLFRPEA
jgi:hypothetical protein